MKHVTPKKFFVGFFGIMICGLGVGILARAGLGTTSINTFFLGLLPHVPFTLGQLNSLFNGLWFMLAFLIDRKKLGIATIMGVLFMQYPVDLANAYYPTSNNFVICMLSFLLGIVLIAFGAGMMIASGLGATPYDSFMLAATERYHINYYIFRYSFEAVFLIVGFVLGGKIGVGTIAYYILIGPLLKYFAKIIQKLLF